PTPAARADGLSGAPVPAPSPAGAAFERGRLNERAGSFPSLDFPQVVPAAQASFMTADTLVCGATQNGEARAYPLFMLQFHHIANDTLGGLPYLVTF
ncbi:MAG: DUF3179 domain-containing protein, partial [Chloroflexi bacterium]|nr:DUF3179 domain-containing protein [Chloroflexota bacterium]